MTNFIAAIVLLLLALAGVVVRKTYFALPVRELKRRAARHERPAAQLYRAVAYGNSLRMLLWLYIGLTSAASLVILARELPVWVSLLIVGPLLWVAFSLLPATRTTKPGTYLTLLVTPSITWLLNYLHPVLSRSTGIVERRYKTGSHTGIFERDDLLELIKRQKKQPDNRLTDEELEIIKRVLEFDNYTVGDIMTPRKQIKVIQADDTVGPVLIDEVHQSGQDFALVRESRKGDFVGILAFQQLNLETQGKVQDIMRTSVNYLHEADKLGQALHAFFTTNQPIFVVVNSAEEFAGALTITTVLKQLLGHMPGEEFDEYANPTAVAQRHTEKTPVKTDEEVIE